MAVGAGMAIEEVIDPGLRTILLVGSNPPTSTSALTPFKGTRSGSVLSEWQDYLGSQHAYFVINASSIIKKSGPISKRDMNLEYLKEMFLVTNPDKVIALGKDAARALRYAGVSYFEMPHPSGRNRLLNDKAWVKIQLRLCKEYVDG